MNRRIVIFALLCVLALGGISAVVHMHNKTGNQIAKNMAVVYGLAKRKVFIHYLVKPCTLDCDFRKRGI